MKAILLPFSFYPDVAGGSEIFVESLAHHLQAAGIQTSIAVASPETRKYEHQGLVVRRFAAAAGAGVDLRKLYGEGDDLAALEFAKVLDEEQPQIVHFHSFTMCHSVKLVREAKRRRCKVLFTYHVPTGTCVQGTLMRNGQCVCDGRMETRRCSRCVLRKWGLNPMAANAVGSLPPSVGRLLGRAGFQGGAWTALRATELIELQHRATREFISEADRVIAVCYWVKQVLLLNGVPENKIALTRYGLTQRLDADRQPPPRSRSDTPSALRVVLLGRLDPIKGVHVLIEAFLRDRSLNATLDVYGVNQSVGANSYQESLQRLATKDSRISFHASVPAAQIVGLLKQYDCLAVPSQWLETGPLVVLEAFAAGIPVLGSRLGGIAELVQDDVNGMLVEAGSAEAWAAGLAKLAGDPQLLERLKSGIRPPRMMAAVADETIALYEQLVSDRRTTDSTANGR